MEASIDRNTPQELHCGKQSFKTQAQAENLALWDSFLMPKNEIK